MTQEISKLQSRLRRVVEVLNASAADIDVGRSWHHAAVPPDTNWPTGWMRAALIPWRWIRRGVLNPDLRNLGQARLQSTTG